MIQSPMTIPRRSLLLIAIPFVALAVIAVAFLPLARPAGDEVGGMIGATAPSLSVDGGPPPTIGGEIIDLEAERGNVIWLNFWTTSCVPCRTEMPAMQELVDRHAAGGLRVVGIDVGEGAESVGKFVDEIGVTYPIVLDFDSVIFNRYSPLFGVPRHYFVGRDGTIVAARIGELLPEEMEPLVQDLLSD